MSTGATLPLPVSTGAGARLPPGALLGMCLMVPAALLVGVFFILPLARLAGVSLGFPDPGVGAYKQLLTVSGYAGTLATTLKVSAIVTVLCVVLGYPVAFLMSRSSPRVQALIAMLVLLPFWTSLLVRNYALIYILQRNGVVNRMLTDMGIIDAPLPLMFNEFGVVVGMTNALLPFMVFPIYVSLQAQDKALVPASSSLGATPSVTFFTVTLPLSVPGIAAGAAVTFATALGFYVTPALLGGGKVLLSATYIAKEINEFLNWPTAAAASMVLLAVVMALLGLQRWAGSLRGAVTRN